MITTLKIKYNCNNQSGLQQYIRQYNSCLHVAVNLLLNESEIKSNSFYKNQNSIIQQKFTQMNNIELMNYWMLQSCIDDAVALIKSRETLIKLDKQKLQSYKDDLKCLQDKLNESKKIKTINSKINKLNNKIQKLQSKSYKIVFGGRSLFEQRCKRNITHDEFKQLSVNPLYSIGDKEHTNRLFKFISNTEIIFKPSRDKHFILNISDKIYRKHIQNIIYIQENKLCPITYKLDNIYIYISYDTSVIDNGIKYIHKVNNRVMSIDLNPNYIGWVITDWKSESQFNIIKSGVISIKQLNDKYFSLKNKGLSSESSKRIHLSNKRKHEIFEISKQLINICIYYKCQLFGYEQLKIYSDDKNRGKRFNSLCNNLWCRNELVNNLVKRCDIFGIKYIEVKPEYSSFVGNFLFRSLNLPDMCLASFEIGRRTYEFYNQHIIKTKDIKKNIVFPDLQMYNSFLIKSLEEFDLEATFISLLNQYNLFKKSKTMYRLSIDKFNLQFSRLFSHKSNVNIYYF